MVVKMKNNFLKFLYFEIGSTVFSVFSVLTISYFMNIIYLIGDPRQLDSLFEGIVAGSFIYSILGSFFGKKSIWIGLIITGISITISAYLLYSQSLIITNEDLFLISFLVTSPILPITIFYENKFSVKKSLKVLFSIILDALFILFILIFAILYEKSGQTILPLGISFFAYISIFISVLLLIKKYKGVDLNA